MPGLTITTGGTPATGAGAGSHANPPSPPNPQPPAPGRRGSRASSPSRPPVSPITPTLGPIQLAGGPPPASQIPPLPGANNNTATTNIPSFAQGRPVFTHSQPDQVGISQLPPAQPIPFDDNPDVLALKSAISILQLQRARAQADMQALNQARAAALADPGAFIADLSEGRVNMEGDPLFSSLPRRDQPQPQNQEEDSSSSSSSDEDEDDEANPPDQQKTKSKDSPQTTKTSPPPPPPPPKWKKGKLKKKKTTAKNPWQTLPKAQTVVRMPPINWAQYGVVGESLDKLHAEQIAAPSSGTPVPLGPGGVFEFKAATEQMLRDEQASAHQLPQRLPGIAAPYTLGKDKIVLQEDKGGKGGGTEKKGRAGKR